MFLSAEHPPDAPGVNLPSMVHAVKRRLHASQVFGGVNTRQRGIVSHCDCNGVTVPERAQLLERLEFFKRRALEPRIGEEELSTISIDADMPVTRKSLRQRSRGCRKSIPRGIIRARERVARKGYRRPAEVARQPGTIENDLDDVGVEELGRVPDGVTRGGYRRLRRIRKHRRDGADQTRFDERFIALDVYNQTFRCEREALHDLGDPIGARGMIGARHHGLESGLFHRPRDIAMVGGDVDLASAAFARALGDTHDHGLSPQVGKRLSGKAAGGKPRRNDGDERHFNA